MAHVGIQTWGTRGDVEPFLALAGELAARGHQVEVAMATASDARYRIPEGVTVTRAESDITEADTSALVREVAQIASPLAQGKEMMRRAFDPYVDGLTDMARDLVERSDVIVRHHFLSMAQAAARARGLPEVSVFLTPDLLPTREHPPTGMPSFGPLQGLAWWMMAKGAGGVFMPSAIRAHEAMGLERPRHLMRDVWSSREANLIAVSPAMCPRPSDWPDTHHVTGFWRGPMSEDAPIPPTLEAFLAAGDPPVYATFGSMTPEPGEALARTVSLLTAAAQAAGRRIVVQAPSPDEWEPVDGRLVVEGSPHARVFPRCAAVIHHGGAGTTQTAVRAGAPSVVVPHLADQFFWGAQLEKLGVGVATRARRVVEVKDVARALARTLGDPEVAARAVALAAQLEAERGVSEAAGVVESLLG